MTSQSTLVQAKGRITIPLEVREKLNLKKGDRVVFVETEQGYVIQPAEVVVSAALREIGKELKMEGVTLEKLQERGREIRTELIEEEYHLIETQDS